MEENHSIDQAFIRKFNEIVLANLQNENFGVNDLARESGMSLYNLSRRLHSIRKKTINQFIREVRLQKAMEMLWSGTFTAAEVAYKTGFGTPAYFHKRFHEFFGDPPGKVLKASLNGGKENLVTKAISIQKHKNKVTRKLVLKIIGFLLLACSIVLIVFQVLIGPSNKKTIDDHNSSGEKLTVAVMPFLNMTNNTKGDIWQIGLQTNLIYRFANLDEIKVRQMETVNIEALDLLQKSWDMRMQNARYDHRAFLHLEAAKKAVGGQR